MGGAGCRFRNAAVPTLCSLDTRVILRLDKKAALPNDLLWDLCVLPKMPLLSELLGEELHIASRYQYTLTTKQYTTYNSVS